MNTKKKRNPLLILGLSAMALGACHNIQYKNPGARAGNKHSVKQSFFLWGIAGGDEIDLQALCPAGVAEISSQESFVDALIGGLTAGLYTPRSVEVTCQSGVAYRVEEDSEGNVQVATNPAESK